MISNAQWLSFIQAGGYQQPQWWLDAGWAWAQAEKLIAPMCWHQDAHDQYERFSLNGLLPLDLHAPVSNISYFEADAFAIAKPDLAQGLFGQVWL